MKKFNFFLSAVGYALSAATVVFFLSAWFIHVAKNDEHLFEAMRIEGERIMQIERDRRAQQ